MSLRTLGCGEVTAEHHGSEQTFAGWIHNVRIKGPFVFVELRDRTGIVQFAAKKGDSEHPLGVADDVVAPLETVTDESAVTIRGRIQVSEKARAGYEVVPLEVRILNEAATPLPMAIWDDAIETGIDTRLDNRFLDVRTPRTQAIFRIRSEVLAAGRAYFGANGFTEITTSNIIAASSEGGTDVYTVDWFGRKCFLSQSPQLYKQMMMASGLDRVFEIARYFRAEKHNTTRHLNESTAFDFEMAWIESEEDVMAQIEGLLHAIWKHVAEQCPEELAALGVDLKLPARPFRRVTYTQALDIINAAGSMPHPLAFGDDIGTEAEKVLGRAMADEGHDFYFITKWPLAPKPFYVMPEAHSGVSGPDQNALCRGFDLDYKGVELISGGQRIHDVAQLEEGIRRWGMHPADFGDYLAAFRYGMPPHGGCGIGIERILMQMLGLSNIREAILFPRDMQRVTP